MKVIERDPALKQIVIVLNDREQDGRDVSWIYDTHFEKFMNPPHRQSGVREPGPGIWDCGCSMVDGPVLCTWFPI